MNLRHLADEVAALVGEKLAVFGKHVSQIASAIIQLDERLKTVESRQPERGPQGEKGDMGPRGESGLAADAGAIAAAVEAHMRLNPPSAGAKGDPGQRGEKGDPGPAGQDGRDAEVGFDDIVKAVETVHERLVAKYMLDLERRGTDAIQKAIDRIPPPKEGPPGQKGDKGDSIKGEKGDPGPAGKDGLSIENLTREYDPVTHEIVESWKAGEVTKTLRYSAGGIRPGGYWKERTAAKSGEAWTHEGTLWIAMRDTSDKPSLQSKDWVIGARKGRDGESKPVKL